MQLRHFFCYWSVCIASQKSERPCICVLGVSIVSLSKLCSLGFWNLFDSGICFVFYFILYMFAGRTSIATYQLFFCLSPLYFIMLSQSKDAISTTILSQSQDASPTTIRSQSKDAIPTTILSVIRFWKNTRHFDKSIVFDYEKNV